VHRWLAVVGVGIASAALAAGGGQAGAQTPPTRAFGLVTIEGRPAPPGTAVQALIGEKVCGEGTVRRVSDAIPVGYVVDVAAATQTPGCGTDGDTITFKVGGVTANEKTEFRTGTFVRLDLTVSGQVSTPTPGPTPLPFGPAPATPAATGSPTPAVSPTAGQPPPDATATLPRFTVTPAGDEVQPANGDGDGSGAAAVWWAVVAVAAVAAAGAAGYLVYRRRA
jgi:hypothetical protein